MKNIAIFASGSGTNAENICEYFKDNTFINISLILTNNSYAGVIERAKNYNIDTFIFNREMFYMSDEINKLLESRNIDLVVLAGFLWLVPENLIRSYPNKIINIHPALLPKYGGKGMYGMNVHNAVIANKEAQSGISIHLVNEEYDDGQIIFQAKCEISPNDTPDTLAKKIHSLEYKHFPTVINTFISKKL